MESTYGDHRQSRKSSLDQLEVVIQKVLGRGGTLIIPAFAVGRTQELLYLINKLETDGRIPSCPVYLDRPMANSATDIYLKYNSDLKTELRNSNIKTRLSWAEYTEVHSSEESMNLCASYEPKIIISAADVLTGGRVLHQKINVGAEIFSIDGLSAHADCEDLTLFAQGFAKKPERVFLNHGELEASKSLQYILKNELGITAEIAAMGVEYVLS